MKKISYLNDEQSTFILKFEEIKEQVFIVLEKLLKITTSQITTSHLSSMQTAIQTDCENILQELTNSKILIESNSSSLTSQSEQILVINESVNSLLQYVPSDLLRILNNLETLLTNLTSQSLSHTELLALEERLNESLTAFKSEMISSSISSDEPLNMEDRLKNSISNIHSLCENIQTAVNQSIGISAQVETLSADVLELQSSVSAMQSDLSNALQYIRNNGSLIEPEPPFNPPPDTILCTRSVTYHWRRYFGNLNSISLSPEYFVINNNVSGILKIEYDIEVNELIEGITSDVYLNDELVDRITFDAEVGIKHITHIAIFQLNRTDGHFQVKINSVEKTYRHIFNIKYEIVGDNAVLLRENLPTTYDLLLCGNNYYFTRSTSSALDYLHTTMLDTDFTQDFQSLVSLDRQYYYRPVIIIEYNSTLQMCSLVYLTYVRLNLSTNAVEVINPETGLRTCSFSASIKGVCADIVEIGSAYSSSCQICTMMTQHSTQSTFSGSFYSNLLSVSTTSVKVYAKNYVNFVYLNNSLAGKGKSFYQKVLILCQDSTGNWFLENKDQIENQMDLALGFGTKVKFSYCPTFIGGTTTRNECFRVFMFVYDHWVAKYFEILRNNITCNFLKAKVIEGDFDQILPGSGNEYFTVKNGSITKHIDEDIKSLDEYYP